MNVKTPTQVVDEQLAAYNARDIDRYYKLSSAGVMVHSLGDGKILMQGIESLRVSYQALFAESPGRNATVTSRIQIDDSVIHEEQESNLLKAKL